MLVFNNYLAFRSAARKGNLEVVKFLWESCPENKQPEMLAANDYSAFGYAAENGHLEVVKFLLNMCPEDDRAKMLAAHDYRAFRWAAENAHLNALEFLFSVSDEPMRKEIFLLNENLTYCTQRICQRREIQEKFPNFNIDEFNSQLTLLTKNPTLVKLLLTCKNLPQALGNSIMLPELLAETANFVCGKNKFNSHITDPLKAAQAVIASGASINSPEFFLQTRENRFNLAKSEADQYIHSSESCIML